MAILTIEVRNIEKTNDNITVLKVLKARAHVSAYEDQIIDDTISILEGLQKASYEQKQRIGRKHD